jgi:hypothetical protein
MLAARDVERLQPSDLLVWELNTDANHVGSHCSHQHHAGGLHMNRKRAITGDSAFKSRLMLSPGTAPPPTASRIACAFADDKIEAQPMVSECPYPAGSSVNSDGLRMA